MKLEKCTSGTNSPVSAQILSDILFSSSGMSALVQRTPEVYTSSDAFVPAVHFVIG